MARGKGMTATGRGENLSDIIRAALVAYINKWGNK